MRNRIIFGILKLITLTLLTLTILTIIPLCKTFFQDPSNSLYEWDPVFFFTYKFDRYNEFVKTEPSLPSNFVPAEDVTAFGSFKSFEYGLDFQYGLDGWERNKPQYAYSFEPQNGVDISLHIYHHSNGNSWDTPISKLKLGSSMLELKTKDSGCILSNGLEYRYVRGKLYSISWRANGVQFYMHIYTDAGKTPTIDTDTILGKLLSKSSVLQREALHQLPNSVGNVGIPPSIFRMIIKSLPFAVFALIAALLGLIFVPHCRKEHEHPRFYNNNFRNL